MPTDLDIRTTGSPRDLASLVRSDGSANRLRVLLITARADHGGGPRHMLDLLKSLSGRGIEFYIGSPNQEPYASQFRSLTKNFVEIPVRSFSPIAFLRLLRNVRSAAIDVVHSHGRGAGIYSRLLGIFTGARVLHTFHGVHREPTLPGRFKLLVDQLLAYFPFRPIYVSENESREALEFHCVRKGNVGYIIENAVDSSRFSGRTAQPLSSKNQIRIGAFLRDDQVKGPDLFLRLVNEVGEKLGDTAYLSWSCAGITREELARHGRVPAFLEIVGKIPEPASWLKSLDVFTSTARNEGLPLGVLEAMSSGCLCVLSDIAAHRTFSNSGVALLFKTDDPLTLTDAISKLVESQNLQISLASQAHALIASKHSLHTFAEKLEHAYR